MPCQGPPCVMCSGIRAVFQGHKGALSNGGLALKGNRHVEPVNGHQLDSSIARNKPNMVTNRAYSKSAMKPNPP